MPKVCVRYFAAFREASGMSEEVVESTASTAAALFEELRSRHGFHMDSSNVRVALNQEFHPMSAALSDGDEVVFVPPVAGG